MQRIARWNVTANSTKYCGSFQVVWCERSVCMVLLLHNCVNFSSCGILCYSGGVMNCTKIKKWTWKVYKCSNLPYLLTTGTYIFTRFSLALFSLQQTYLICVPKLIWMMKDEHTLLSIRSPLSRIHSTLLLPVSKQLTGMTDWNSAVKAAAKINRAAGGRPMTNWASSLLATKCSARLALWTQWCWRRLMLS